MRLRYSPRPNRAHEIDWRPWSPATFEEARAEGRPVLLVVTTVWCQACHELDETTLSDPEVIALANEKLIPIRVDGDALPHVQERYIDRGWPTVALLAPTGEVFWSDTDVTPPELVRNVEAVLKAWETRREKLEKEIGRRRKALEAARSRRSKRGLLRRESADDVLTGAQNQFDPRNGGFGTAPKFIHAEAVELLLTQGADLPNPDWIVMAERTLDGMLAGEIEDRAGGFFHYAMEADWTAPQTEKLLPVNARTLQALAFAAGHQARDDWRDAAERIVDWVEDTLARDGLWARSQAAAPDYYAGDRVGEAPPVDDTVYTDAAAQWIAALAGAGRHLERPDWVERAQQGLNTLLDTLAGPGGALVHSPELGEDGPLLLVDQLHGARAAVALAEAGVDALDHAVELSRIMRDALWDEDGGFVDFAPEGGEPGGLKYPDRPFEENALAARLHVGLARATGDRSFLAVAESVLAFMAPFAGRYAVEGATFAMAVEEFFRQR